MTKQTATATIALRGLKINKQLSEETTCFSATLMVNGKPAAKIGNRGHGGDNMYDVIDHSLMAIFRDYCKDQPMIAWGYGPGETMEATDETVIARMMDELESLRQVRGWCKKWTVFRMRDDKPGEYQLIKVKWSHPVKELLQKKYGDQVVEWTNETI
jgi:hypothetical protein